MKDQKKKQRCIRSLNFLVGLLLVISANRLGLQRGLRINDQALKEVLMENEETTVKWLFENCIIKCHCLGDNTMITHDPYTKGGENKEGILSEMPNDRINRPEKAKEE